MSQNILPRTFALLAILLLTCYSFSIPFGRQPPNPIFEAYSIQTTAKDCHSSSVIYYSFPTKNMKSEQVAIGLSQMHLKDHQKFLRGWRSYVVERDEGKMIVVNKQQGFWSWDLRFTVLQVLDTAMMSIFADQVYRVEVPAVTTRPQLPIKSQSVSMVANKVNNQNVGLTISPFILLTGVRLLNDEHDQRLIELNFYEFDHNGTHIILHNQIKGVKSISYSLVVFCQAQLLSHSLHIQTYLIGMETEGLVEGEAVHNQLHLMHYYGLRNKELSAIQLQLGLQQETGSVQKEIQFKEQTGQLRIRIAFCQGYWSIGFAQCFTHCSNITYRGQLAFCQDQQPSMRGRMLKGGPPEVPCPPSVTNCQTCYQNFGSGNVECSLCIDGYYISGTSNICQVCPPGCITCEYRPDSLHTHCDKVCYPTYSQSGPKGDHLCYCSSNQVTSYATTPSTCVNCPAQCSFCTSLTVCSSCTAGFYLSGTSCIPCMPVCKTCTSGLSCSSCKTGLVVSGNECICSSPLLLNKNTTTCQSCISYDPNCVTCTYNPSYSASAPVPVVCSVAIVGYFVLGGVAVPCALNCDICTSNTVCTNCSNTFTLSNGSCLCSPLSLTNTNPPYCDNCTVIIPGCDICVTATTTQCSVCISNYFPNTIYPTTGCTACPVACSSCDSPTICLGCYSPFALDGNGTDCLCTNASLYVNTARDNCVDCNQVIVNCQSCNNTLPTLCLNCDPGYSVSFDGVQCFACIINCASCNDTACISCNSGYTVSVDGSSCGCDITCQDCLSNSSNACSSCTMVNGSLISCSGCAAGWFLSNTTCMACLMECQQCVDLSSCISCKLPLILNTQKRCECDYAALVYLTPNGTDCQPCASIQANCVTCETVNWTTICSQCVAGRYFNTSQLICVLCDFPCSTCSGSGTYCDSCEVTYSHSPGTCYCDNLTQLFYSPITQGCLACSSLIPNCASCQTNANDSTQTYCLTCSDPYYLDSFTNTCVQCDPNCLSCTSPTSCSSCASNLIGNGTHCYCNLTADPTLTYYSATNMCVSCLNILTNCISCNPDPLACTGCANGSFLNGSSCLSCASECETCDSLGCLSCPMGTTLESQQCVCGAQCTSCLLVVAHCVNCTIDANGMVTNCYSCHAGYQIAANGVSCVPCPSGCATCSGGSVCTTCILTFILTGVNCQCDSSLNLYISNSQCQLCGDIIYGCIDCSSTAGVTSCFGCAAGMYLNGTSCSYCSSGCLTCSSQLACTSCPTGLILQPNGTCSCVTCANCNTNVPSCVTCQSTIMGAFGQCTSCLSGTFLNASNLCEVCPGACITCDDVGNCTSCAPTLELVGGTCDCNSVKLLMMNSVNGLCEPCSLYYEHCASCISNASIVIGYICFMCQQQHYWFNDTCTLEVCGDGIISPSELCDDANDFSQDGCFNCFVEPFYNCTQEPSVCLVITDFQITFDSVEVSTIECNVVVIYFKLTPLFDTYNNANFSRMYAYHNQSRLLLEENTFVYSEGYVGYKFRYIDEVVGLGVLFLFTPRFIGISQTLEVPLFKVFMTVPQSINSVQLKYQPQDVCIAKEAVNQYIDTIQYTSYGILALSALPCKIVGLQMFGVLQLSFLSLGSIDHLNPLLASLTKLSFSNGYSLQLDNKEATNTRLLQSSALTSNRVQTIGYASNFLRNCNVMLWVVLGVILVSFILFLLTYCCPSKCFQRVASRLFKQLVFTLVLFNCFNFAYCTGLHFAYADENDYLFLWGTVAAVASLVVPFLMVLMLQCSEEEGFGEYKDKLRRGKLERAYFMITIGYRIGIGYYLATANEDDLSTLLVLAMSLCFLLYNLVNLPFSRAYHNYRACLCHLSQFFILFITMYYRSMRSGASAAELDSLFMPVYLQLGALGLCVFVSLVVLIVQICIWVGEVREWCEGDDSTEEIVLANDTQQSKEQKVLKDVNEISLDYINEDNFNV